MVVGAETPDDEVLTIPAGVSQVLVRVESTALFDILVEARSEDEDGADGFVPIISYTEPSLHWGAATFWTGPEQTGMHVKGCTGGCNLPFETTYRGDGETHGIESWPEDGPSSDYFVRRRSRRCGCGFELPVTAKVYYSFDCARPARRRVSAAFARGGGTKRSGSHARLSAFASGWGGGKGCEGLARSARRVWGEYS